MIRQCTRNIFRPNLVRPGFAPVSYRGFSSKNDDDIKSNKSLNRKTVKKIMPPRSSSSDMSILGFYDGDYSNVDSQIENADRKTVHAVCSAESYDLKMLFSHLSQEYNSCKLFGDEVIRFSPMEGKECFIFKMGSFVGWGLDWKEFNDHKGAMKRFEVGPLATGEFEEIEYVVLPERDHSLFLPQVDSLMIIGGDQSEQNMYLDQLAFSHGIANSVKLAVLESQLEKFINSIGHLPVFLQRGHRIPLTRTESLRKMGELLQFRAVLNLHSDLLETPDLYWNYSKLEKHFGAISMELDIKKRVDTLNKRLDYAKDITELLKGYLSEKHGLSLEWAIIALISVEVGFELLHFAERYYF